ncbi:glycerophosphodiester phosphodiesterase family protein [Arenimonas composti]|uniref:glycerophosphodiester phosphodiesterase n=1 Tax=Arenimonas composti TR7-09 = DSM 18010 TaxID=1121013 RepID=A0A091B6K1_9GAMM|nr:glycerophosphodiester phosphodiesterase family protein [Arenimonas composti]KFN47361.1 hypothetical protein P873_01585 [Arenimonas composti TR7-09 = DSM 18010]
MSTAVQWPVVIAHRGASGSRPEHTLASYALAIGCGADFIEPDLVASADGVLVARHDNALSATTDVAARPEFAGRRCRKCIDGEDVEDWFVEDFTWAELATLRARERLPELRPASAAHDGRYGIPRLADIVALVRAAERRGRHVGIYPEIKHPTWFAAEGRRGDGRPIGIDLGAALLRELQALEFTDPARIRVQSFEPASLLALRRRLDAAGLRWPLVQLLGRLDAETPYDLRWHHAHGDAAGAVYGPLAPLFAQGEVSYRRLVQADALAALRGVVDVLAPHKDDLLEAGEGDRAWLAQASALGFAVVPYTLRAESGGAVQARRLLELGVDGWFIDQPALGVAVRAAWRQER